MAARLRARVGSGTALSTMSVSLPASNAIRHRRPACEYAIEHPSGGAVPCSYRFAMTFEERLAARATVIDRHLDHLLGERAAETEGVPPRLAAAMRHAVMAGGKRVRPLLVIESAAVFRVEPEVALPAALALELVHCYSLVHDDLPAMDNDTLRRGQPTVWKAFDD